jgi:hypothetical protein
MSLIHSNTLNKRELTRINFLSQEDLDHAPTDSEISPFFPVICGKIAENYESKKRVKVYKSMQ